MRTRYVLAAAAMSVAFGIVGCGSSPTRPSPPTSASCSYQLTTTTGAFGADGGTASITVSTAAHCVWSARVDVSWISIVSGSSGTGPGTIALTVAANTDAGAREASVIVSDQSLRLTQQGRAPCEYAVSPADQRFGPEGGSGTIAITSLGYCAWTAVTADAWITLTAASGTGSGSIAFSVAAWSGAAQRTATIRVADRTVSVRQDRDLRTCEYSVAPPDFVLHWHGLGGEITVTTDADCVWTATAWAAWLTIVGPTSRSGTGALRFSTDHYTADATRKAPVEVRWPTPTAGQNVWVTQEGCRYGVYPVNWTFDAAGGRGSVNVLTQPISPSCSIGCPWRAEPAVPWIRITSGSPGSGDNPFHFEVSPNTGPARTGTIRVADHTVTITQSTQRGGGNGDIPTTEPTEPTENK